MAFDNLYKSKDVLLLSPMYTYYYFVKQTSLSGFLCCAKLSWWSMREEKHTSEWKVKAEWSKASAQNFHYWLPYFQAVSSFVPPGVCPPAQWRSFYSFHSGCCCSSTGLQEADGAKRCCLSLMVDVRWLSSRGSTLPEGKKWYLAGRLREGNSF